MSYLWIWIVFVATVTYCCHSDGESFYIVLLFHFHHTYFSLRHKCKKIDSIFLEFEMLNLSSHLWAECFLEYWRWSHTGKLVCKKRPNSIFIIQFSFTYYSDLISSDLIKWHHPISVSQVQIYYLINSVVYLFLSKWW